MANKLKNLLIIELILIFIVIVTISFFYFLHLSNINNAPKEQNQPIATIQQINDTAPENNQLKKIDPEKIKLPEINDILLQLLNAEKIFIHSNIEIADIDNDRQEDIIIFATVVGGERPVFAKGDWAGYNEIKHSNDLIVLTPNENNKFIFKYYYINGFDISNAPKIWLEDFNQDQSLEIILSTSKKTEQSSLDLAIIYQIIDNHLQKITFSGGKYNNLTQISGALSIEESKATYLKINFDEPQNTYYIYNLEDEGLFKFVTTNSQKPTITHQEIIDKLKQNITSLVRSKPVLGATSFGLDDIQFYPDNVFLASFSDGHYMGIVLGQYKDSNLEYIDQTLELNQLEQFRQKNNLEPAEAINYQRSVDDYYKINSDVFLTYLK